MTRRAQAVQDTQVIEETEEDSEIRKYKQLEEKCDIVLAKIRKRKNTKRYNG
jgi:hypothetical protein